MLKARNAVQLAGFSNKSFMEVYCPAWFQCTLGACGLSQEDLSKCGPDVNSLALATATITCVRNATMFHSGVKHDDLIRLNRLDVCMSQDATVIIQKKMNEQL